MPDRAIGEWGNANIALSVHHAHSRIQKLAVRGALYEMQMAEIEVCCRGYDDTLLPDIQQRKSNFLYRGRNRIIIDITNVSNASQSLIFSLTVDELLAAAERPLSPPLASAEHQPPAHDAGNNHTQEASLAAAIGSTGQ